jgi:hypothetical protein
MTEGRQIENCQAAIAQPDFHVALRIVAENNGAAVVGPAVGKGAGGALENVTGHARIVGDEAEDSAHQLSELSKILEFTNTIFSS